MNKKNYPKFPHSIKVVSKPPHFCGGCGHTSVLYNLGFVIDELEIYEKTVIGFDIGCSLLAWDFYNLNTIETHHGRTVPVIVGVKYSLPDSICIAYMGDGGSYAIGAQHLVNSARRNDPITVMVINNSVYAMTGGQQAPTTVETLETKTDIRNMGKRLIKGPQMVRSLNTQAYIARTIATDKYDVKKVLTKALFHQKNNKSFSFVEILSPCPTTWKMSVLKAKEFVENKMIEFYPLGEF
jgi:2-oxoglutarate ferredoxin oxidoreductase subunit beta